MSLYFYDMRNFGTLKVSADMDELQSKLDTLGLDWLCEEGGRPTKEQFQEVSTHTHAHIYTHTYTYGSELSYLKEPECLPFLCFGGWDVHA